MKTIIVIPARWDSKRFPGKPLAKINGKEVIKYVWEKANLSKLAEDVVVATDDNRIENFCKNEDIKVLMTSKSNLTGSDRVYEVSKKINFDFYCNVQGDEPLIDPENIDKVILCLKKNISKKIEVSTGYSKIKGLKNNQLDPLTVYLFKLNNQAQVFFRGNNFENSKLEPLKHIGLYAYTRSALERFHNYKRGKKEISESLEQMRFIENNEKIACTAITDSKFAVDFPNDIKKIESYLKKK